MPARSPIPAGLRRHSVLVQAPSPGSPPSQPDGDVRAAWADVPPAWQVAIEPAVTNEQRQAGTSIGSATHTVTGPYRADVTLSTRLLVEGTRAFNIVSRVDPEDRHRELILQCREVL
jgi:head-tail adaptor